MQDTEAVASPFGKGAPLEAVEGILDRCTSCGLCNAACPTFAATGDERESPRGRIAMMNYAIALEMRGSNVMQRAEAAQTLRKHLDRCVNCLACMPVCPESVDYGAALDTMRSYVTDAPRSGRRARLIDLVASRLADPQGLRPLFKWVRWLRPIENAVPGTDSELSRALSDRAAQIRFWDGEFAGPGTARTTGERKARVLLLPGCNQQALRPSITDAAIRMLARGGVDVVVAPGTTCCGAIDTELGHADVARAKAATNITAWSKAASGEAIDFVISTSASCGQRLRRYGEMFGGVVKLRKPAEREIEALDLTELMERIEIGPPVRWFSLRVGYLGPCTLRAVGLERSVVARQLAQSGFMVRPYSTSLECCGGYGAYPFVEAGLAGKLRAEVAGDVSRAGIDLLAVHDVGCVTHLTGHLPAPVVHIVELLDWAHGGPTPPGLEEFAGAVSEVPKPRSESQ